VRLGDVDLGCGNRWRCWNSLSRRALADLLDCWLKQGAGDIKHQGLAVIQPEVFGGVGQRVVGTNPPEGFFQDRPGVTEIRPLAMRSCGPRPSWILQAMGYFTLESALAEMLVVSRVDTELEIVSCLERVDSELEIVNCLSLGLSGAHRMRAANRLQLFLPRLLKSYGLPLAVLL